MDLKSFVLVDSKNVVFVVSQLLLTRHPHNTSECQSLRDLSSLARLVRVMGCYPF